MHTSSLELVGVFLASIIKTVVSMTAFAVLVGGCTSLQPVDLPVAVLRENVRVGDLTEPRQLVSIVTEDGATHEFEVVEVNNQYVQSDVTNILIDDIVSLDIRQFDLLRTSLVAVGVVVIIYAAAWDAMNTIIDDLLGD